MRKALNFFVTAYGANNNTPAHMSGLEPGLFQYGATFVVDDEVLPIQNADGTFTLRLLDDSEMAQKLLKRMLISSGLATNRIEEVND